MSDTSAKFTHLLAVRYAAMSPEERVTIASDMFETARAIVESSLPEGLTSSERRLAYARRMYGTELPESMLKAYADGKKSG